MELNQNKLFNPITDIDIRLIGGKTNGIANLTKNKYSWSKKLYDGFLGNFWIPSEVSLGEDAKEYKKLSKHEQESFDKIISFLVFLDSMVTNALPYLSNYITAPEVQILLTTHAFQEAVHSQSYAYVLETVVSAQKREHIYNLACTDEQMLKRNSYIAKFHQNFIDNPTKERFLDVVIAQYCLEGIYFQSGFLFFFNLAKNNRLTGVGQEIQFISRDENTHMALFSNIYKELKNENPELFTEDIINKIYDMVKNAVEQEIEWFSYVCGDNIEGLTNKSTEKYIKYLGNQRLKTLGLKEIYPEAKSNPFPFIAKMSNPNSVKVDFFESKVVNYAKAGKELALDDLDSIELEL